MKKRIADQKRKLEEAAAAAAAAPPSSALGTASTQPGLLNSIQQLKPPPPTSAAATASLSSQLKLPPQQPQHQSTTVPNSDAPLDQDSKPAAKSLPAIKVPPSLTETYQKILDDILGTSSQSLGLTIAEKTPPPAAAPSSPSSPAAPDSNERAEEAKVPKKSLKKPPPPTSRKDLVLTVEANALVSSGQEGDADEAVLDMYSYHRGREGLEARSALTGELLCDVPYTDTNYKSDAPKTKVSIQIEFPLEDDDKEQGEHGSGGGKGYSAPVKFKETVIWDMADPNTVTPQEFAMKTAQDFGLSFGQAMDMAFSIQQQLDSYTLHNCKSHTPALLKDVHGNERSLADFPSQFANRYGDLLEPESHGFQITKKLLQHKVQRGPLPPNRLSTTEGSKASSTNSVGETSSRRHRHSEQGEKSKSTADRPVKVPELRIPQKYFDEVIRRLKVVSALDIQKRRSGEGPAGLLKMFQKHQCHACHKPADVVYSFACGVKSHTSCTFHCDQRFPDADYRAEQPTSPYCPICCLICTCARCKRKLEALALDFQIQHKKQGDIPLAEVHYRDILALANEKSSQLVKALERAKSGKSAKVEKSDSGKKSKAAATKPTVTKSAPRKRFLVPKAPLNDFPREVIGARDFEPGTEEDYMRVYTADGAFPSDDIPSFPVKQGSSSNVLGDGSHPSDSAEVLEDGNVDFCQTCLKAGNIICCDFCPRAFHKECIPKDEDDDDESATKWKCHTCKTEDKVLEEDLVTVEKSVDLITAAFLKANVQDETMESGLKVLSLVHAMLGRLIEYDFGYMFSVPVDTKAVEGYKDLIKRPMDLGTIGSRLTNGYYANRLKQGGTWDDVIASVLQDVELVWHNCYTFNFEGSAIFRMADVLRKRAKYIAKASFNGLTSDDVKQRVSDFIQSCEEERKILGATKVLGGSGKFQAFLNSRPKGLYKIKVKVIKGASLKPIAVLDPDTSRIFRIFSSMKSASDAALIVSSQGNQCEWKTLSDQTVKGVVKQSSADPKCLLFGYRWLSLQDLRNGKVKFPKFTSEMLEMRHHGRTVLFRSMEAALSSPMFPKNLHLGKSRDVLKSLPSDGAWTMIDGTSWRRVRSGRKSSDDTTNNATENREKSQGGKCDSSILQLPLTSREQIPLFEKAYIEKFTSIVKYDFIAGSRLLAFETIELAHQDWLQACQLSPSFPPSESMDIENFKTYYLNGDRNIDGMFWRAVRKGETLDVATETTKDATEAPMAVNGNAVGEAQVKVTETCQSDISDSKGEVVVQGLAEGRSAMTPVDQPEEESKSLPTTTDGKTDSSTHPHDEAPVSKSRENMEQEMVTTDEKNMNDPAESNSAPQNKGKASPDPQDGKDDDASETIKNTSNEEVAADPMDEDATNEKSHATIPSAKRSPGRKRKRESRALEEEEEEEGNSLAMSSPRRSIRKKGDSSNSGGDATEMVASPRRSTRKSEVVSDPTAAPRRLTRKNRR